MNVLQAVTDKSSCANSMVMHVSGDEESIIDLLKQVKDYNARLYSIYRVLGEYPHVSLDKLWELLPEPGFPGLFAENEMDRFGYYAGFSRFLGLFLDKSIETGNLPLAQKIIKSLDCSQAHDHVEICVNNRENFAGEIVKSYAAMGNFVLAEQFVDSLSDKSSHRLTGERYEDIRNKLSIINRIMSLFTNNSYARLTKKIDRFLSSP